MTKRSYKEVLGLITIDNHANITAKINACFDRKYSYTIDDPCCSSIVSICNSSIKTIDLEIYISIDNKNKHLIKQAQKWIKGNSYCKISFNPIALAHEEFLKYEFSGQIIEVELWENYLLKLGFSGMYHDKNHANKSSIINISNLN